MRHAACNVYAGAGQHAAVTARPYTRFPASGPVGRCRDEHTGRRCEPATEVALATLRGGPEEHFEEGVMTITVHLHDDLAATLEAEAARRGQSPEQVAADLLAERLTHARKPRRKLAFAGIGESSSGRSAAEADEMLAEGFGRDRECGSSTPARWPSRPTALTRTMPPVGRCWKTTRGRWTSGTSPSSGPATPGARTAALASAPVGAPVPARTGPTLVSRP